VLFTDNVETELLVGKGWALWCGILLRKNQGKTTGWLAYIIQEHGDRLTGCHKARNIIRVTIVQNDLTLVLNHEFSGSWSAGFTFVYFDR